MAKRLTQRQRNRKWEAWKRAQIDCMPNEAERRRMRRKLGSEPAPPGWPDLEAVNRAAKKGKA